MVGFECFLCAIGLHRISKSYAEAWLPAYRFQIERLLSQFQVLILG